MQCGAKTRSGEPCKNPPVSGSKRCRMHGGKSKKGLDLPQTTHGRNSNDVVFRLREAYERSRNDPNLLDLSHELAIVDARSQELLSRIDIDGAGALWMKVGGAVAALDAAVSDQDWDRVSNRMEALRDIVQRAEAEEQAWKRIFDLSEQRRKLVETETKRRVAMSDSLTPERASFLLGKFVDVVMRHVRDRSTLAAIAADFRDITGQ